MHNELKVDKSAISNVWLHDYLKGENQRFLKNFLSSADSFGAGLLENFLKNVDFIQLLRQTVCIVRQITLFSEF